MRFTSKLRSFVLVILLPVSLYLLLGIIFRREIRSFALGVLFLGLVFLPQKNLTIPEGQKWYSENKAALMELHKVVLQTSDIRRVEPGTRLQLVLDFKSATPETMPVYNELTKICESLGIKHIAVFRMGNNPEGLLVGVRYTLSSSGLCVSGGRSLSIEFVPDKLSLPRIYDTPEYVVTPLDEENWYLVDYRDGRK